MTTGVDYSVVVPTIGRRSLQVLLGALAAGEGPRARQVVVVDDRRSPAEPLALEAGPLPVRVVASGGRGPAAARNVGWRATSSEWVAFLDDDVVPGPDWPAGLAADLEGLPWQVAGSQGRLAVPLPVHRPPTDWERNTAALVSARWATADLAYRREVLREVGGFDERFTRAFREDADLGLRVAEAGYLIVQGSRQAEHPVRPAGRWVSVRLQAGNADDVLMRARHGVGWRSAAGAEAGRNGRHLLTTAAGLALLASLRRGRRRSALVAGATWAAATAQFAAERIAPGPRSVGEVATMVATSVAIPPVAVAQRLRGLAQLPGLLADEARAPLGRPRSPLALQPAPVWAPRRQRSRYRRVDPAWKPAAVLFDRDGTLVADLPGNRDPARVAPMPGAVAAVRRARAEGLFVGVVTNQSAVALGRLRPAEVDAVNRRVDEWFGPFDTWQVCMHAPADRCPCRKPAPGLVTAAAGALGVDPYRCAVIGDTAADMGAAEAAGARGVLVPTPVTRAREIALAPVVAADLSRAVDLVLAGMC